MDFNAIYEVISPYLGTGAIATAIVTVLGIAIKVVKLAKEAREAFTSTHSEAIDAFKKAIPKDLYISVEALTKSELAKITQEITKAVDERFLKQISANTELTQAIAVALMSIKSIPDSSKDKIAELLKIENKESTERLKVELIDNEVKTTVEETSEKVLLD